VTFTVSTGSVLENVGPVRLFGTPISVGDLAFQPGTGKLFGLRSGADGEGLDGQILTIGRTTATATYIGPFSDLQAGAIAFGSDGTLYQSTNSGLRKIDLTNGSTLSEVPVARYYAGLGHRKRDGVLFGAGLGTLRRIDPSTGQETELPSGSGGALRDVAFPRGPFSATASFSDKNTMTWIGPQGLTYDIVRGNLMVLLQNGGDFGMAIEACVGNDVITPTILATDVPAPGEVLFWIVRANALAGPQTYDTDSPGQTTSRDAGIAASGMDCP
jgi:hypothetical protein